MELISVNTSVNMSKCGQIKKLESFFGLSKNLFIINGVIGFA